MCSDHDHFLFSDCIVGVLVDDLVGLLGEIVGLGMTQLVCRWHSRVFSGSFSGFSE